MFKKVLVLIVALVLAFLGFAATRPGTYRVFRTIGIEAPRAVVFAALDDWKSWSAWSPWEKLDPAMTKTFEGPPEGVGAAYAWQGNDKVGKGKMTIVKAEAPTRIEYKLEFVEPFAAVSTTSFALAAAGEKGTTITWSMEGSNNFIAKVFGIFMNMDKVIGSDFERGLASLKQVAEGEAAKVFAAEAAAKAKADVEAAAAAKAKTDAEAAAKAAAEAQAAEEAAKSKGKRKKK